MIDSRYHSLRAALTDPEPKPLFVELGTLQLIEAMSQVVEPGEITRLALGAANVPEDEANAIASKVTEVITDVTANLGNPDPVEDAKIAGPLVQRQADLARSTIAAIDAVPAAAASLAKHDERSPRQRGTDSGVEQFWHSLIGEKAPELVAGAVGTIAIAAAAGTAYAAGLDPSKVAIGTAILKALRALSRLFK